jgi:cystathionine beta-lyase/cystathionine gamma-synthase
MLESPTNPRMQITDIRGISELAHAVGALVCVDNSIMTPVFQKPLELGADISMTSATKFICGHSDVTGTSRRLGVRKADVCRQTTVRWTQTGITLVS